MSQLEQAVRQALIDRSDEWMIGHKSGINVTALLDIVIEVLREQYQAP